MSAFARDLSNSSPKITKSSSSISTPRDSTAAEDQERHRHAGLGCAPSRSSLHSTSSSQTLNASHSHAHGASDAAPRAVSSCGSRQKRSARVIGFLALKEPSSSALHEYAQQEKQKAGRSPVKTMPGLPTQRLPDHVPKVNAKWDGMPEHAQSRNWKDERSQGYSTISPDTQALQQRLYGSLSSRPSIRWQNHKHSISRIAGQQGAASVDSIKKQRRLGSVYFSSRGEQASQSNNTQGRHHLSRPSASLSDRVPSIENSAAAPWCKRLPDVSFYPLSTSQQDDAYDGDTSRATFVDGLGTFWNSDSSDDVTIRTAGPDVLASPRVPPKDPNRPTIHARSPTISRASSTERALRLERVRNFSHVAKYCSPTDHSNSEQSVVSAATCRTISPEPPTPPTSSSESNAYPQIEAQVIVHQQVGDAAVQPQKDQKDEAVIVVKERALPYATQRYVSVGPRTRPRDNPEVAPWETHGLPAAELVGPRAPSAQGKRKRFSFRPGRKG